MKIIADKLVVNIKWLQEFSLNQEFYSNFLSKWKNYQENIQELNSEKRKEVIQKTISLFLNNSELLTDLEKKEENSIITASEEEQKKILTDTVHLLKAFVIDFNKNKAFKINEIKDKTDATEKLIGRDSYGLRRIAEDTEKINDKYDSLLNNIKAEAYKVVYEFYHKPLQRDLEEDIMPDVDKTFLFHCFKQQQEKEYNVYWNIIIKLYSQYKDDNSITVKTIKGKEENIINEIIDNPHLRAKIMETILERMFENFDQVEKQKILSYQKQINKIEKSNKAKWEKKKLISQLQTSLEKEREEFEKNTKLFLKKFSIFLKIFEESYQQDFSVIKEIIEWNSFLKTTLDKNKDEQYNEVLKLRFDLIESKLNEYIKNNGNLSTVLLPEIEQLPPVVNEVKKDEPEGFFKKTRRTLSFKRKKNSQGTSNTTLPIVAKVDFEENKFINQILKYFDSCFKKYFILVKNNNLTNLTRDNILSFLLTKFMQELKDPNSKKFNQLQKELNELEAQIAEQTEIEWKYANDLKLEQRIFNLQYLNIEIPEILNKNISELSISPTAKEKSSLLINLVKEFFYQKIEVSESLIQPGSESLLLQSIETAIQTTAEYNEYSLTERLSAMQEEELANILSKKYREITVKDESLLTEKEKEQWEEKEEQLKLLNPLRGEIFNSAINELLERKYKLPVEINSTKNEIINLFKISSSNELLQIINFTQELLNTTFKLTYDLKKYKNIAVQELVEKEKEKKKLEKEIAKLNASSANADLITNKTDNLEIIKIEISKLNDQINDQKNKVTPFFKLISKYTIFKEFLINAIYFKKQNKEQEAKNDAEALLRKKAKELFEKLEQQYQELYLNEEKLELEQEKYIKIREQEIKEQNIQEKAKKYGYSVDLVRKSIKENQSIQNKLKKLITLFPIEEQEEKTELINDWLYNDLTLIHYQCATRVRRNFLDITPKPANSKKFNKLDSDFKKAEQLYKEGRVKIFNSILSTTVTIGEKNKKGLDLLTQFENEIWTIISLEHLHSEKPASNSNSSNNNDFSNEERASSQPVLSQ